MILYTGKDENIFFFFFFKKKKKKNPILKIPIEE